MSEGEVTCAVFIFEKRYQWRESIDESPLFFSRESPLFLLFASLSDTLGKKSSLLLFLSFPPPSTKSHAPLYCTDREKKSFS